MSQYILLTCKMRLQRLQQIGAPSRGLANGTARGDADRIVQQFMAGGRRGDGDEISLAADTMFRNATKTSL